MAGIPPNLKEIAPIIQRAEELKTHDPLVSYYCRLRAVEIAIQSKDLGNEGKGYLIQQMDILEKQKSALKENNEFLEGDDARSYLQGFVSKLFDKADKVDRAGAANKTTAMTFYAASVFFRVLEQFGELVEEDLTKSKYAKWKAAEIMKALRAGETPKPGSFQEQEGGGEVEDAGKEDDGDGRWNDTGEEEQFRPPVRQPPQPGLKPMNPETSSASSSYQPPPLTSGYIPNYDDVDDAKSYCKDAMSSMDFEDYSTSIALLQKAIKRLTTGRD